MRTNYNWKLYDLLKTPLYSFRWSQSTFDSMMPVRMLDDRLLLHFILLRPHLHFDGMEYRNEEPFGFSIEIRNYSLKYACKRTVFIIIVIISILLFFNPFSYSISLLSLLFILDPLNSFHSLGSAYLRVYFIFDFNESAYTFYTWRAAWLCRQFN